jgi:preprotein translocase subunit YajC
MPQLVFLLVLFGVMYLVTVRPQQQRLKAQRQLIGSLEVGDEILTAGGLIGRIVVLGDRELRLDVGGMEVRVIRAAVTDRMAADPTD